MLSGNTWKSQKGQYPWSVEGHQGAGGLDSADSEGQKLEDSIMAMDLQDSQAGHHLPHRPTCCQHPALEHSVPFLDEVGFVGEGFHQKKPRFGAAPLSSFSQFGS